MSVHPIWKNKLNAYLQASLIMIIISISFLSACQKNNTLDLLIQEPESTLQQNKDQSTLRITNGYWPPYNGENFEGGGCDTKIVTETFKLINIQVEYGYFPWARSYALAASGEWDGAVAWDDTPRILEENWASAEPTSVQDWVFFSRTDNKFEWQTLDDLNNKNVGITVGYLYAGVFDDLKDGGDIHFIENTTDEANFKMLFAGRIDVFPMEKQVGQFILNESFSEEEKKQITFSDKSFANFESHLLLTKVIPENEQIMKEFDKAFQKLKQSGRYNELILICNP